MKAGMTLAEREEMRQQMRDRAVAEANKLGRSMVCSVGNHDRCGGEQPGSSGCLCECHDYRPAASEGATDDGPMYPTGHEGTEEQR